MTSTPRRRQPPAGRGPGDRARLADVLHAARRDAGLTGVEAGKQAGMSQSKISKIERGFLLPSLEDVTALCRVYGIAPRQRRELTALATGLQEEASNKVILARGAAENQRRIGQLESSARLLRGFQPALVIGLLQTADYMRCVFGIPDSAQLAPHEIDEAAEARTARQRLLDDQSKQFVLIMTEGALRWQAGSAALMVEQMEAIAEAVARPNVRIGLIPWTRPVRIFPRHGFHLYDHDAVIVGTETAMATITGAADIATYDELFRTLEEAADFGDAAQDHLARIAHDYHQLIP